MKKFIYVLLFTGFALTSCKKDWLEAKPKKSLVVPETLDEYQKLLNNRQLFGTNYSGFTAAAVEDVILTDQQWQSLYLPIERFLYNWDVSNYKLIENYDWNAQYQRILGANVVLDGLGKIHPQLSDQKLWNSIRGQALLYRAYSFYSLAQVFCKTYDETTASTDLGIPLKISPEVSEKISRSTLKDTYNQIIADLNEAYSLLPVSQQYKTQPSKNAVKAVLARIYLSMNKYDDALTAAEHSLSMNDKLLNYNTLDLNAPFPFSAFNEEVIWHIEMSNGDVTYYGEVTDELFKLYDSTDLRKNAFFLIPLDYLKSDSQGITEVRVVHCFVA